MKYPSLAKSCALIAGVALTAMSTSYAAEVSDFNKNLIEKYTTCTASQYVDLRPDIITNKIVTGKDDVDVVNKVKEHYRVFGIKEEACNPSDENEPKDAQECKNSTNIYCRYLVAKDNHATKYQYYIYKRPDLVTAGVIPTVNVEQLRANPDAYTLDKETENKLINHFVLYGIKEGMNAPDNY